MPDKLDQNGLVIKTYNELLSDATTAFQGAYGNDINLNSNSPDGQIINFIAQIGSDIRELIVNTYNSFSRDRATGIQLDERASMINGIRVGATFTITPITIIVSKTVTLQGLDADINNINGIGYTISDNIGNKFILTETVTLSAGTYVLDFRAANIGLVSTIPNTITNQITIILGVVSVNNPTAATTVGQDEESDMQFKFNLDHSIAIASIAQVDALQSNLYAITGVTEAIVYENLLSITDINGIPPNGFWVIVEGGNNTDIAQVIYNQLNANNMKGSVSVSITTGGAQIFVINFDRPAPEDLYIKFNIKKTVSSVSFDLTGIKNYIAANLTYSIGEYADTSKVTSIAAAAIESTTGRGVAIDVQISNDGITYVDYLATTTLNNKWSISTDNIGITVL